MNDTNKGCLRSYDYGQLARGHTDETLLRAATTHQREDWMRVNHGSKRLRYWKRLVIQELHRRGLT